MISSIYFQIPLTECLFSCTLMPEVVYMTLIQKIKMLIAYSGISEAELARRMDTSPSAFHQRLKTGRFTVEELERIAAAVGGSYVFEFRFPDGTTI